MDEFELIKTYFVRADEAPGVTTGMSGVTTGIGDDGAVLQPDSGRELISVIDTLVEGIHFPDGTDPFDIAYRAVAVNLSDIAAMGGRPRWMSLALSMPAIEESWIGRFAEGLHGAAAEHQVVLVGGDTTQGKSLVVSVQITGDIVSGTAIKRSGAQAGDQVYVTGTVGDAAAGLELLIAGDPQPYLSGRFLRPNARVAYGQALTGVATAAIDVSDGLFADLSKLLTASGVGAVLQLEKLPLSQELCTLFDPEAQRRFALSGGDDYELCFTAAAGSAPVLGEMRVTGIGSVTEDKSLVCHLDGQVVPYADSGYRHFQ